MNKEQSLQLPINVLTAHVFPFLGVKSLKKCASVSKDWKEAVDQDILWMKRCGELWQNKRNVPKVLPGGLPESLYPFASYPPSTVSLGIKELRQILIARGVYSDKFLEKNEYLRALEVSQKPVTKPLSHHSKWKLSYIATAVKAMRQTITRQELISSSWIIEFKFNGLRSDCKFLSDGSYWSNLGNVTDNHRNLKWNPLTVPNEPFEFTGVRVGEYPALMVSRTENWGYRLENDYVYIHQG